EAGMEDDRGHLRPEAARTLGLDPAAPPRRRDPDEHAGSDRRVHQDGGGDEEPGAEHVEQTEAGEPGRGEGVTHDVTHHAARVLRDLRQQGADGGQQGQDGEQEDRGPHLPELAPQPAQEPARKGTRPRRGRDDDVISDPRLYAHLKGAGWPPSGPSRRRPWERRPGRWWRSSRAPGWRPSPG